MAQAPRSSTLSSGGTSTPAHDQTPQAPNAAAWLTLSMRPPRDGRRRIRRRSQRNLSRPRLRASKVWSWVLGSRFRKEVAPLLCSAPVVASPTPGSQSRTCAVEEQATASQTQLQKISESHPELWESPQTRSAVWGFAGRASKAG